MQVPTLTRAGEQRNSVGQSIATPRKYVQFRGSKGTVSLGTGAGRIIGRNFSVTAGCAVRSTAGIRQRLDVYNFDFARRCSAFIRAAEASMLGLRRLQTKAQWRSGENVRNQALDHELHVNFESSGAVKDRTSKLENLKIKVSEDQAEQPANSPLKWSGSVLAAMALSLTVLAAPGPTFSDSFLTFSNSARADQVGQVRQAASLLEKAVEGLTKIRFDGDVGLQVLDKAVTVVTGSSFIDPQSLDKEVDGLLSGEKDVQEELRNGISGAVQNSWSTIIDVLTNFNPGALSESAGASISTFLESGAERVRDIYPNRRLNYENMRRKLIALATIPVSRQSSLSNDWETGFLVLELAAFELSALVSLGERWLILTPLLVIPMAWEMNRLKAKSEKELRDGQEKFKELSGQSQLRGEKVRRELERIELRKLLLDAVNSLGKTALQPPRTRDEAGMIRRSIKGMLERLEDLKPVEDPLLLIPAFASTIAVSQAGPSDPLAYLPTGPTVDGLWRLIYVSETNDAGGVQEFPQFPGIGLDNICQKVWQAGSITALTVDNDIPSPSPLLARNTAEIRLGPLGAVQVAIQGSWENLKNGQTALVSFDTISARPVEIFGNKISDDVPEFNFLLPSALQRSAKWAVAYVDNHVRINRGGRGQLFLFCKVE